MCQFNFEGTVTKDVNTVKCFVNISIPDILDNDMVVQRKFTMISTVNSGNSNNDHYIVNARKNFSLAWYHCNDAAVINHSEEVLENNAIYILFYKAV